ncbi:hypothetical protein ACLOJK_025441 [Asimina triloba]
MAFVSEETFNEVGRIGIGICYDIRFQELAMLYGARGAHLICYPGAFNMTTGPLHWELLQRARAADNQLYVATCSPARDPGAGYIAWGHSTLVGPRRSTKCRGKWTIPRQRAHVPGFGEVIATTEHDEAIVIAEIDYSNKPANTEAKARGFLLDDELNDSFQLLKSLSEDLVVSKANSRVAKAHDAPFACLTLPPENNIHVKICCCCICKKNVGLVTRAIATYLRIKDHVKRGQLDYCVESVDRL